jgi:hypothetical protein
MWNYCIHYAGTHRRRGLLEATVSARKSFPELSCKFLLPMSSNLEAPGVLYLFHELIFARTERSLGPSHLQYLVNFCVGTQVWTCPSPFEAEFDRCAMVSCGRGGIGV